MEQKYSSPTRYNDSLNESITKGNRESARVFQPQWVNNQTRLNSSNVELMRSNLMTYIEKIVASLHKQTNDRLNQTQKESAGWVIFEDSEGILGEVFNEEPIDNSTSRRNNAVSKGKTYQAVFGQCNIANGNAQFVCGKYNSEVTDALLIVGCGDANSRDNALVVKDNGDVQLCKNVTVTGTTINLGPTNNSATINLNGNSTVNGTLKVTGVPTDSTHVIRKKELDALRSEISGALHYIGVVEQGTITTNSNDITLITISPTGDKSTTPYPASSGDVVLEGKYDSTNKCITTTGKEYILSATTDGENNTTYTWVDYGSSDNYVLKLTYDVDKKNIETSISTETSERVNANKNLAARINNEETYRKNADKAINKAAFGQDTTPTDINDDGSDATKYSLQKQIDNEKEIRSSEDGALFGTDDDTEDSLTIKGLRKRIDNKEADVSYNKDTGTTYSVGGLVKGTTIGKKTIQEVLDLILFADVAPTVSNVAIYLTGTGYSGNCVKKGSTTQISRVTCKITKGTSDVSTVTLHLGSNIIPTNTPTINGTTYTLTPTSTHTVSTNTVKTITYKVTVTDAKSKSHYVNSSIYVVDPIYYGVIDSNITLDSSNINTYIGSLTEDIRRTPQNTTTEKKLSYSFTGNNKKAVVLYPETSHNKELEKITDANGFSYSYSATVITINGVNYYMYVSDVNDFTDFTYNYHFYN